MKKITRTAGTLALLGAVIMLGCQSDAQRIRATNEAVNTPAPTATSAPLSAEIDAIDLQDGDCINSTLPEGIGVDSVEIVPCNGPWQYRVLSKFEVPERGSYPGMNYFVQQANQNCDRRYTYFLYPLRESWMLGDREVDCLQESFGLSVADPTKLDRLVNYLQLRSGDCYNEASETDQHIAEIVNCSEDWEYRVTNRFDVTDSGAFPGDDFINKQAFERCNEPYDFYLRPSEESWKLGDKAVLCIEEGF